MPLIHKMWPALIHRFNDEINVSHAAFGCLLQLSYAGGDFIRKRCMTDFLPRVLGFLDTHVLDGPKKRGHRYTIVFKLQLEALEGLGHLVSNIQLDGKDLRKVVATCFPYTEKTQPQELQEAAARSIDMFARLDADSVWFLEQQYMGR